MTNREYWLHVFQTNDVALIAAINLVLREGPKRALNKDEAAYVRKKQAWLDEETPADVPVIPRLE